MQVIGFAPWKPLPPLIDDPEWDAETFSEQQERLARTVLPDDGGAAEPGDGAAGADGVA